MTDLYLEAAAIAVTLARLLPGRAADAASELAALMVTEANRANGHPRPATDA